MVPAVQPGGGGTMRYEKADRIVDLALEMQAARMGLTLEDIEGRFRVGRRTAQRMRDAVLRLFPHTEEMTRDDRRKCWRIPPAALGPINDLTADDLADLEATAALLKGENLRARAKSLERIAAKVKGSLRPDVARRVEPDLELLLEAEGLAMRPGPRPAIRSEVIEAIRSAIKQQREVYVSYRKRRTNSRSGRHLQPYGILLGNRHYLVAMSRERHADHARLYSLANIDSISVADRAFVRDRAFSLRQFAERSFGVFQEPKLYDVAWRFSADVAASAEEYTFHPSQIMELQKDGSLIVRFRACGLQEMCWHLYTWGKEVEVLAPPELKALCGQ